MGTRVTTLLHMGVSPGNFFCKLDFWNPINCFFRQMSYSAPETPSNEFQLPQDEWGLATKLAIASISSQVNIQNTSFDRRIFEKYFDFLGL